MGISTIESVASFSAVLAETFAAVGLSTLIPNTLVLAAKAAKGTPAGGTTPPGGTTPATGGVIANVKTMFNNSPAITNALTVLQSAADTIDHVDLLVPKRATIDAEFEFQASEKYSGEASIGGAVDMVSVKAGYSALYESSSKNKVTLHVEFGLVGINF